MRIRFRNCSLMIIAAICLELMPQMAAASTRNCIDSIKAFNSQATWQRFRQSMLEYRQEVIATRGRRLFLKISEGPGPETAAGKWHGFIVPYGTQSNQTLLGKAIRFLPQKIGEAMAGEQGYSFTPWNGIYHLALKEPVEYLSEKFGSQKMGPAFFLHFPVILTTGIAIFWQLDALYQERLQAHIDDEIARYAIEYDKLIQTDFRYHKIKKLLVQGTLSVEEAQKEAYLIGLAYAQYFEFLNNTDPSAEIPFENQLLDHYLFVHLKEVIVNGVHKLNPSDGYLVPNEAVGPLNANQVRELFNNNHQRYLKYQIIAEIVGDTTIKKKIQGHQKLQGMVDKIMSDPFTIQLMQLHATGKLNNDQLQYYLQEDAYWQNKFQDWQTIGVIRLQKVNGQYGEHALTLTEVRSEILAEIEKNKI